MQGTLLNERYRIDRLIGEGGMARVYLGRDLVLDREVAIKILRDQYAADENFLKRFAREGQIAAGMTHPNIVSIYDVGHDGPNHFLVMEFVRGPNLKELIHRQGPFSIEGAVFIISQVASALDYAHQRGLVHRDIKPQNILVDRDGNAKVADFGIAKGPRDQNLTETGTGMGTVHYVSPEQARGGEIGPSSDLYSTGVVLFEMLTKELPFDADTPVGVAMQQVSAEPPRPSSVNPNIPPKIDQIVLKSLAKDPADRYSSGAALEQALRYWNDPQFAPTATAAHPTMSTSARNPTPPPTQRSRSQPSRKRRQGRRTPPPPPPPQSAGVGCGSWLIGILLLIVIVGTIIGLLQYGPELFEGASEDNPTATPTEELASEPTETVEIEPTATATVPEPPTATPPPPTETPIPTTTPEPTATVPQTFPTPSLVNATVEEAQTAVADRWELSIVEEFNNNVEEGVIFQQDPEAGVEIELGTPITIWVSKGPDIVTIPDVIGKNAQAAINQIENAGFDVVTVEEPNSEVETGRVIRTEPSGSAPRGASVTVVISQGDVATIPDLRGESVIEATGELIELGVVVSNVTGRTCDYIETQLGLDCDQYSSGEVVAIQGVNSEVTWGDVVEPGTIVNLVYLEQLSTP